jgi:hypothetical protein
MLFVGDLIADQNYVHEINKIILVLIIRLIVKTV